MVQAVQGLYRAGRLHHHRRADAATHRGFDRVAGVKEPDQETAAEGVSRTRHIHDSIGCGRYVYHSVGQHDIGPGRATLDHEQSDSRAPLQAPQQASVADVAPDLADLLLTGQEGVSAADGLPAAVRRGVDGWLHHDVLGHELNASPRLGQSLDLALRRLGRNVDTVAAASPMGPPSPSAVDGQE